MPKFDNLEQLLNQNYAPQGGHAMFMQMLNLKNSQESIARYFGVSFKTVNKWVQRHRLESV